MVSSINRFTDKKLKALLGTTRDKEIKVSDGGGLMIRVTKNGAIGWFYKYRIGGRETNASTVTLGRYPDLSLSKAREMRDQCREWLANGKDPKRMLQLDRSQSLRPVTVRNVIEYWLSEYADGNLVNAQSHRTKLEMYLLSQIGDMALSDCETRYWLECFTRAKKTAPSTAGLILQLSQQALKFCKVRQYASSSALDGLTMQDIGVKVNRRKRVLTNKELTDLLVALKSNFFSPYYHDIIYLLLVFGARTRELRLSTCEEWDLESGIWTVPEEHSKTRERIIRPIPERLYPMISQLKRGRKKQELLLGKYKENTAVSSTGRRICGRLNHTESWGLHDLRRTFSTCLSDLGIAPHIVELLLGHTLPGIMAIYNRSQYIPEKLDALNKWVERLDVLAGEHENVVILKVGIGND